MACNHPRCKIIYQRIGLGDNLQENPIFNGKNHVFPVKFPLNQSIEYKIM